MSKILKLGSSALLAATLGSAQAGPVTVTSVSAGGFGADLSLSAAVTAPLGLGTATLTGSTPTPAGFLTVGSAGGAIPQTIHSTGTLGLSLSGSGSGVLGLVGALDPVLAALSPTLSTGLLFNGVGSYTLGAPSPGFNQLEGFGSVLGSSFSIAGLLGLDLSVIASASEVVVDTSNGDFYSFAGSELAGATLSVLGGTLIDLSLVPSTGLLIDLGALGSVEVFTNEQIIRSDGLLAADCSAAVSSCSVETNAVRLSLDKVGLSLLGLSLETDLDLRLGHSFASATVAPLSPIPEPSTYALMLGGLAAIAALARRRKPAQG